MDLGESPTLSYDLIGLPPGLTNVSAFSPEVIPGLFAWYSADGNESFVMHEQRIYERNDSVALDNLLLHLPFDETNGSIAYDVSEMETTADSLTRAQWADGKKGGSVSFDGSNDGMVFEKVSYMDRPEFFSISFWFKRHSQVPGIPTNHQIDNLMLAQSSSYDNDNIEIGSEGSEIEVYLDSGGGNQDARYATNGANITDGVWHHLVLTYGNGLKVFVDGVQRLSRTPYDGPLDSSQDSPLSLGMGRIFSDQWGDFNGSIDDFRIYDVEVNSTQVTDLYNSGAGDFDATTRNQYDPERIKLWRDRSANQRDAESEYGNGPLLSFDPNTGMKMVHLNYGKSLRLPDGVSMPMTLFLVGFETGLSFPDRELFTFEGWRMINSGRWGLRRWNDNNPALNTNISSQMKSLIGWTVSRYGYEIRVNGDVISTNVSGNWRPEAIFDRINGDTELMVGEILFYPRTLDLTEKQKIEGYLADKWKLNEELSDMHPYKSNKPLGEPGFVLSGTPESAGNYEVTVTASNQWGSVSDTFNLEIMATPPPQETVEATQVGSTSARLQSNIFDLGGMDSNLSFYWGTDPSLLAFSETNKSVVSGIGSESILLTGLNSSTTYYYQTKLENAVGVSNGDSISAISGHFGSLMIRGPLRWIRLAELTEALGAVSVTDAEKGQVLQFDGDNDYVNLGDIDEMDQVDRFTLSLWFKRNSIALGRQPTMAWIMSWLRNQVHAAMIILKLERKDPSLRFMSIRNGCNRPDRSS